MSNASFNPFDEKTAEETVEAACTSLITDGCNPKVDERFGDLIDKLATQASISLCNVLATSDISEARSIFRNLRIPFPAFSDADTIFKLEEKILAFKHSLRPFIHGIYGKAQGVDDLDKKLKYYLMLA